MEEVKMEQRFEFGTPHIFILDSAFYSVASSTFTLPMTSPVPNFQRLFGTQLLVGHFEDKRLSNICILDANEVSLLLLNSCSWKLSPICRRISTQTFKVTNGELLHRTASSSTRTSFLCS